MRHYLIFVILTLSFVLSVNTEGQYTVVGPGTLHSERKYDVTVAVHHNKEPCKLNVGITGPSYNETKSVDLQSNEIKTVEFDVPKLEKGDYNLTTEGVTCLTFKNTTKLNYREFTAYVTIQTDKGKYKPGDEVNFRVLFLDENLRPYQPQKDAVIWFEDGKRNRIKEFKDFKVVSGVYTGKFQISEFPVLGYWRIITKNGDHYNSQASFEVSKYVLPKYTVKAEATDRVSVRDGDMQVVVRANYTYGKPVNAKATIVISLNWYHHYDGTDDKQEKKAEPPTIIKSTDMVNGKAKFDLNVKEYEPFLQDKKYPSTLLITATVEEPFTGVKINDTNSISLYPYRYSMSCVTLESCSTFKADKESEVIVQVTHVDGTPINDNKTPVKLIYIEKIRDNNYWRYGDDDEKPELPKIDNKELVFESHLNETGMAVFKITLPDLTEYENFTHYFEVEGAYADEKREIVGAYQHREPKEVMPPSTEEPKEYLKMEIHYPDKDYSFNMSQTAIVTVNSSQPLTYFIYNIIGRGNIQHTERVEVPDNAQVFNMTLKPTFLTAPYGKIYIYYVDSRGELRYAETTFHIDVELQNEIEITAPEQVKPGEDVALRIKTAPHSFVGLLAVDQSVLLLGSNNDLSPHQFRWRLGSFDTYTPWQGGYSHYPGEYTGVVTLTNADYFYNRTAPVPNFVAPMEVEDGHVLRSEFHNVQKVGFADSPGPPGPAHASADVGGGSGAPEIVVRKDFSETWIFADIENTETEEFTWSKKIPDTITSWMLSGFSMNAEKGLGVTKDKTKITTFQPFFIAIRLPYSVKRGEVINVPALVFNYLDKDLDVQVTLDNTDEEYDFTEVSNEVINEQKRTQTVRVPAFSARGVAFLLRPKIIGNIMLKFTAVSPIAGDAIHRTLKVVPEGVTEYANRAYFVNLKDSGDVKETFELELPGEVVPDSEHIEFTVIGDMLGPVLNNLDNLVRMPTGCGEQTTSTLIPNSLVLYYLKVINKLTPTLETKLKYNLETGYQHILSYRLDGGSFISFTLSGNEQRNGSTWLTAYVLRALYGAKDYIEVDEKIFQEGLAYLAKQQASNGSFLDSRDFYYSTHDKDVSLTADVVLTFVELKDYSGKYQTQIDNGFKYILENLDKAKNLHVKAIATYALHKAEHPMAAKQLEKLKSVAKTEGDRMWWSDREGQDVPVHLWWRYIYSNDIEITSYALLTMLDLESESVESVLPIVKWLVAQRNSYGGFSSTKDTIVGLKALIKFAEKSGYQAATMDISFQTKGGKEKQDIIKVTDDNALLLQSAELPQNTKSVDFTALGKGASLVQISYQYNIMEKEKKPAFVIKTVINTETPAFKLEMDVCVEYTGEGTDTNMALLEVSLPSGYVADEESLERIKEVPHVRHTETKNSDTIVVVYFDSLHKSEVQCVPVEALKSFAVAMQKPATIELYDYYDTSKKATTFYEVSSKLCDICEDDEECKKKC